MCFVLWGLGGLGISIFAGLGAPILTAIYVTLMWMAGVMFFGIALLSDISYRLVGDALPVYVVEKPRDDGLNSEYRGVAYKKLESGHVIAEFADGKHTFKNWKQFIEAVPE
jgi:hypothetical protein